MLVLRSEVLVGSTITIGESFRKVVNESDLTPYEIGVLGAKDRENENLETITLKVDEGSQRITVQKNSQVVVDKTMYFSKGQTREIRVP
ncbi:hypothetical protein GCM10007052_30950 [Halioglobus japonicus]|nr:hypothetical protein GCM10007052_30950 [Halioglobus japonicus]